MRFLTLNIATHFASADKKAEKKEAIRQIVSLLFLPSFDQSLVTGSIDCGMQFVQA